MVALSPSRAVCDGSRRTIKDGMATASTKQDQVPEVAPASTGTHLFLGWTALTGWPSGVKTKPSA